MCFRPANVGKQENKCPKCGTVNLPGATECANCGFSAPATPGVPSAPGVPKAPGVPAAPKAPAVPKAPGVPNPPKAPGQ